MNHEALNPMHQYIAASLASLVLLTAPSSMLAADIPVNARIEEVKVYGDGAMITRRSPVALPVGTHRLVFSDLPATLDPDSLRIAVANRDATLGAIEVERITDTEYVGAQERALRNQLQALNDRRAALQDAVLTAETQLKLLDSLAAEPAGSAAKPAVDAANLAALLSTMSGTALAARAKIRDAKSQQRELDKDLEKINADLQRIATARKQTYQVRAFVSAASASNPQVAIEYAVNDAGWRWVYEARLDTARKNLALGRRASVSQRTGEDWQDARLTLTTAQPAEDATPPQVAALFVDLQTEPTKRPSYGELAGNSAIEAVIVTSSLARADVVATDYIAEYVIPGRVTLGSDGEPRVYPMADDGIDVELVARVIPGVSRAAYLEALFTYQGEVPIQGGKVQLFRDGAFVGMAELDALLPGADARIQFGADERIRVLVRDEPKQSGEKGILSKQRIDEHKQRFEITNYHSIPVTIEVVDRVPVSENKEVRVELLKGATPATLDDLDGKSGVMLWRMRTSPQQTATVRHYYSVRYPAERELREREED